MDRCFNVEEVLGKAGYETSYLFKKEKNRYRDTHCVMENEMHNDYRYSQFSHYVEAIFGVGLESL